VRRMFWSGCSRCSSPGPEARVSRKWSITVEPWRQRIKISRSGVGHRTGPEGAVPSPLRPPLEQFEVNFPPVSCNYMNHREPGKSFLMCSIGAKLLEVRIGVEPTNKGFAGLSNGYPALRSAQ
jgi:hypothetical protein